TRVGNGEFPTELHDQTGEKLRAAGNEYGATTGRPRRCGWLDLPLLKLACRINGFNHLIITKLDCLSGFPEIKIATSRDDFQQPVYQTFPGWKQSLADCMNRKELPQNCIEYLEFIEKELEIKISGISVGQERNQIILEEQPWKTA
ncbi:MAG: adenylosuccinate synthetase, partial [Candidatus Riflebacteria bacterium]